MDHPRSAWQVLPLLTMTMLGGCWSDRGPTVVVYCALDGEFSEPILRSYAEATAVDVRANFDVESTKTVGLVNRIIQEKAKPRCDVLWNNEILHTLRLQRQGLLAPHVSPAADPYPPNYRCPDGYWHGFAARARVLIVNTDLVRPDHQPDSILDLVDPRWKGRVGVAKPLFGTTATHAAVLFAAWGETRAQEFFTQLKENAQILGGNKQVALSVARGDLAFGWTDTDDAIIEIEAGRPVSMIFPDQNPDGLGTLFIPNTVAIIQGGPHPESAHQLVDYLLSAEVEERLAAGPSAQFPINPEVNVGSRAAGTDPVRWMDVDFFAAADQWDTAAAWLRDTFAAAE